MANTSYCIANEKGAAVLKQHPPGHRQRSSFPLERKFRPGFSDQHGHSTKSIKLKLCLVGPGNIGSSLLGQLAAVANAPAVHAICNSKKMLVSATPLDAKGWRSQLDISGESHDLNKLTAKLKVLGGRIAIVDMTANADVAARHASWLAQGFHVVTANKLACAAPDHQYQELVQAVATSGGRYLCETTVGAGLPVISVLRDFVNTGDEVLQIEGVLSGTLSRLVSELQAGQKFSSALRRLCEDGMTEPDPRRDLEGVDVARKILILARTAGWSLSAEDVAVEPFLQHRFTGATSDFLANLERWDSLLEERFAKAKAAGQTLVYVATAKKGGGARVGFKLVPSGDVLSGLSHGENLIAVTSRRYLHPLVVRGPGAGREVTAAGVFADLLRL